MRLQERHRREPATVGNYELTGTSVIVRNIFNQPIDGVVGVGAFVDRVWIFSVSRRPLHNKRAFRAKSSADILKDKNIPIREHFLVKAQIMGKTVRVVR